MKKLTSAGLIFAITLSPFNLQSIAPVIFSSLEGLPLVKESILEHPELLWLADNDVRKTEENQATLSNSYSERYFGQKFMEFDRTLMKVRCLKLILDGSEQAYQEFTEFQPENDKLSKKSFQSLHSQGKSILQSNLCGLSEIEMAQAMETALIIGDVGKSEKARKHFMSEGVIAPDHDDFYGDLLDLLSKNIVHSPSFSKLSEEAKNLLVRIANIAHYGHITHLEGGANMFDKLRLSLIPSKDPISLSFDLFVHTCDVAGALGHVNNRSSLMYTESVHRSVQSTNDSVRVLSDPNKTSLDAYNYYLEKRASWLELNSNDKIDRIIARIGALIRLFKKEDGVVLKEAINSFPTDQLNEITTMLDVQNNEWLKRTPTYIPAFLVNLSNNVQLGRTKDERLTQAILLGMPFVCRVLKQHKEMLLSNLADPKIPLNFNGVAGIAKISPELLKNSFTIDKDGFVNLNLS